jgi:hypothetical protein
VVDDVGPPDQRVASLGECRILQVQRDRPLAGVGRPIHDGESAQRISPDRLQLDDVGAEIREQA